MASANTIEVIENDYWGDKPDYDSHLVSTVYKLRKKNLKEFTTEDLRIVIGQNFSLQILIPLALVVLERNILASGDFYPGDLLQNVIKASPRFWSDNPSLKDSFKKIFVKNIKKIKGSGLHERHKERFFSAYAQFTEGVIVTSFDSSF